MTAFVFAFFILFNDGSRIDIKYSSPTEDDCQQLGKMLYFQFSHSTNSTQIKQIKTTSLCEKAT